MLKDIESGRCDGIPDTIKISSSIYKYPHDYPNNFVNQQYLPNNLTKRKYYEPKDKGYEENLLKIYNRLEELFKK